MPTERRYWDSACFIAVLSEEAGRVDECAAILRAATARRLEIVTSAWTITEVLHPKKGQPLSAAVRARVKRFFRNPGIVLVNVDRAVAESAQEYFWDHNVKPKDAIHVASAVYAGVPVFETYDGGLIRLSGLVGAGPPLEIREPALHPDSTGAPPTRAQDDLFTGSE